jgi:Putative auto-transporter adhesin, head GIN domain
MAIAPAPTYMRRGPHGYRVRLAAAVLLVLCGLAAVLIVHYEVFGGSTTSTSLQGSGVAASQLRDVPPFSGVELAGSNDVTIHVGGQRAVLVSADDNLINRVTTDVRGRMLTVGNTPGSFTTVTPMNVEITVPSLEALRLSGSGVVSATGIDAPVLAIRLSGSGVVHGSGRASAVRVDVSGSGDAELADLVARDARVVVTGTGRVVVTAKRSLFASVTGTGAVMYGGNPQHVTTSVKGVGVVSRD